MSADARPLMRRVFEAKSLFTQSPAGKLVTYVLLFLWTGVVLLPLYWVLITSLKLPIEVNSGPFYLPFIDFQPSLAAWHYIFVDLARDTLRPYLNSVIVALAATVLAVTIGSLAAYALVRISFKVKIAAVAAFLVLLIAVVVAVAYFGVDWRITAAVAAALFVLFLSTLARRFKRALGNNDIEFWIISNRIMPPVVAVLPSTSCSRSCTSSTRTSR